MHAQWITKTIFSWDAYYLPWISFRISYSRWIACMDGRGKIKWSYLVCYINVNKFSRKNWNLFPFINFDVSFCFHEKYSTNTYFFLSCLYICYVELSIGKFVTKITLRIAPWSQILPDTSLVSQPLPAGKISQLAHNVVSTLYNVIWTLWTSDGRWKNVVFWISIPTRVQDFQLIFFNPSYHHPALHFIPIADKNILIRTLRQGC